MGHPFGDLLTQYRARKYGLTQARLALLTGFDSAIITRMCQGRKELTGASGRDRVLCLMSVLYDQGALMTLTEANTLLKVAGMPPLYDGQPVESALIQRLGPPGPSASLVPRFPVPVSTTPLLGRADDMAAITHALMPVEVRLLTLVGPPGVGKTRLALQVASELNHVFEAGTCFVALGPLADAGFVIAAIAQALGITPMGNQPIIDMVKRTIQHHHMLLVLDNFEHVLAAAPIVAELMAWAPQLKVLVTSRTVLHLSGEYEFPIPPLALQPAIALFIQRAQAVKPDLAVTELTPRTLSAICRRLDGLPLAIELAAARTKLFNPEALLARLEKTPLDVLTNGAVDLPARQRMLRGTIEWSYGLLDENEKAAFRRLGVFAGGFTLESAEAVAQIPWLLISSLLDKSLIKSNGEINGESCFTLLELLREYALEKLHEQCETEETQRRHAEYFVRLAEAAEPKLRTREQTMWLMRLGREHDNLRAALQWAQDHHRFETTMRIVGSTWQYWLTGTLVAEGLAWIKPGLQDDPKIPTAIRAKAFHGAGMLSIFQNDFLTAHVWHEQGLSLAEQTDDRRMIGLSLTSATFTNMILGDAERANFLAERALAHTAGSRSYERAQALSFQANILYNQPAEDQPDYAYGLMLVSEGREILHELGDQIREMVMLLGIFEHASKLGDYATARQSIIDGLHLAQQLEPRFVEIQVICALLYYFGWCEAHNQHPLPMARLCAAAVGGFLSLSQPMKLNNQVMPNAGLASTLEEYIARAGDTPDTSAFAAAWDEGHAMTLDEAIVYALTLA